MAAAEAETDDPAEQLVAFVRRFEQVAAELAPTQPGCLFVSFIYESQLAGDGFGDLIAELHPRVARAAAREARSRGPGASARHPRRPGLPRRPRLHRLRGRLHPHPRDGRTDPPARPARPRAPLPRTALRALPRPARTRPAASGHRLEPLTRPATRGTSRASRIATQRPSGQATSPRTLLQCAISGRLKPPSGANYRNRSSRWRRARLLVVVRLSSERTVEAVRQDGCFASDRSLTLRSWSSSAAGVSRRARRLRASPPRVLSLPELRARTRRSAQVTLRKPQECRPMRPYGHRHHQSPPRRGRHVRADRGVRATGRGSRRV